MRSSQSLTKSLSNSKIRTNFLSSIVSSSSSSSSSLSSPSSLSLHTSLRRHYTLFFPEDEPQQDKAVSTKSKLKTKSSLEAVHNSSSSDLKMAQGSLAAANNSNSSDLKIAQVAGIMAQLPHAKIQELLLEASKLSPEVCNMVMEAEVNAELDIDVEKMLVDCQNIRNIQRAVDKVQTNHRRLTLDELCFCIWRVAKLLQNKGRKAYETNDWFRELLHSVAHSFSEGGQVSTKGIYI